MEFQPRSYSQSTVYVTIAAHLECATWPHRKRSLELEFRELENSRESFNGQTKIKKKKKKNQRGVCAAFRWAFCLCQWQ